MLNSTEDADEVGDWMKNAWRTVPRPRRVQGIERILFRIHCRTERTCWRSTLAVTKGKARFLTEHDRHAVTAAAIPPRLIGYFARRVAQDVKLPSQFAALVPKVREFAPCVMPAAFEPVGEKPEASPACRQPGAGV